MWGITVEGRWTPRRKAVLHDLGSTQGSLEMNSPGRNVDLFFDEAGYTGPDLVNLEQPVFVRASSILDKVEATHLLDSCFGSRRRGEVKHSKFVRRRPGRSRIIEFLRQLAEYKGQSVFYAVHKEYVLLAFLVDFWLEPALRADGINLYERGANIGFVNMSYMTLGATLGPEGRRELLRRFQVMVRDRTIFAYESFWGWLREAAHRNEIIDSGFGPLLVAERRLGFPHLCRLPPDLLDLGDYGFLPTIDYWREELPNTEFLVFHDTSAMVERNRERWEAILDPKNPSALVGQDRRTIVFPLPVRGLRTEDSSHNPQLQVVDLLAGAARKMMNALATGTVGEYEEALLEIGLLDACIGCVWPSTAVTSEALDTEGPVIADAAEFITEIVQQHQRRTDK
jgi:hypothetical protein